VGSRRNILTSAFLAPTVTLALLGSSQEASADSAPPCDPQVFPAPFLVIDGSAVVGKTRYIKLRLNRPAIDSLNGQSDPEYPFSLTVAPSNGGSSTHTVRDYAKDEFPAKFATGETDLVTATYVEVHTSYGPTGAGMNTRCSRTVSARLREPPTPRSSGGSGKRHRRRHHESEDAPDR
jgi:hypothetical protein